MAVALVIAIALIVLLGGTFVLTRSSLSGSRERVREAQERLEAQLRRRRDLVPTLVETATRHAGSEHQLLGRATETCGAASEAAKLPGAAATQLAEARLSGPLGELRWMARSNPELAAAEGFQRLDRDLGRLEEEIEAARRTYNANVQSYNARIQVFPNSLVARFGGLEIARFFEIVEESDPDPDDGPSR